MFDPSEAKAILLDDRHKYLKKTRDMIDHWLNHGLDEAATQCMITTGEELNKLMGSILYLEQLEDFSEYPRFVSFGDCNND